MEIDLIAMPGWQILCIAGVLLIILEMLTPAMFFLNLALACFVTAFFSLYTSNLSILAIIWVVASLVCLLFVRPLMVRKNKKEIPETGMGRYIGAKAKVLEEITPDGGVVSVFDERWNARSLDSGTIAVGTRVKIEKYEDLVLYVRKDD